MHVSYVCILIAAFLPLLFTAIAKLLRRREFDNRRPRDFQARLDGTALRAHWAHLNSFEAFPPFAAGVLVAQQMGAPQTHIDVTAVLFVVLRLGYGACYLADLPTLRSLVWAAATVCTAALFFLGA